MSADYDSEMDYNSNSPPCTKALDPIWQAVESYRNDWLIEQSVDEPPPNDECPHQLSKRSPFTRHHMGYIGYLRTAIKYDLGIMITPQVVHFIIKMELNQILTMKNKNYLQYLSMIGESSTSSTGIDGSSSTGIDGSSSTGIDGSSSTGIDGSSSTGIDGSSPMGVINHSSSTAVVSTSGRRSRPSGITNSILSKCIPSFVNETMDDRSAYIAPLSKLIVTTKRIVPIQISKQCNLRVQGSLEDWTKILTMCEMFSTAYDDHNMVANYLGVIIPLLQHIVNDVSNGALSASFWGSMYYTWDAPNYKPTLKERGWIFNLTPSSVSENEIVDGVRSIGNALNRDCIDLIGVYPPNSALSHNINEKDKISIVGVLSSSVIFCARTGKKYLEPKLVCASFTYD